MGNGMTHCCREFTEDTTGKDPCCSVPTHDALVNWVGMGILLLNQSLEHMTRCTAALRLIVQPC